MDPARFDHWTKFLVAAGTRRRTLRLLGATGLSALLLGHPGTGAQQVCKKKGESCNPNKPEQCCSRRCRKGKCHCIKVSRGTCTRSRECCGYPDSECIKGKCRQRCPPPYVRCKDECRLTGFDCCTARDCREQYGPGNWGCCRQGVCSNLDTDEWDCGRCSDTPVCKGDEVCCLGDCIRADTCPI
jgi:hypothetical protein